MLVCCTLADPTWSGNCTSGEQTLILVYLCQAHFYKAIKLDTHKNRIQSLKFTASLVWYVIVSWTQK